MKIWTTLTHTVLTAMGTVFVVPGSLLVLFGFAVAGHDAFDGGEITIPYLQMVGPAMTGMVLFVVGSAAIIGGLTLIWQSRRVQRIGVKIT